VIEHYVSLNAIRHFTGARLTMNVAANAQLHHIKLAFENPASHHFAHNDLLLGPMPPHTATVSCWAGGAAPQHQHAAQR
jgi:Fe-S cluster assembly protein SufD